MSGGAVEAFLFGRGKRSSRRGALSFSRGQGIRRYPPPSLVAEKYIDITKGRRQNQELPEGPSSE